MKEIRALPERGLHKVELTSPDLINPIESCVSLLIIQTKPKSSPIFLDPFIQDWVFKTSLFKMLNLRMISPFQGYSEFTAKDNNSDCASKTLVKTRVKNWKGSAFLISFFAAVPEDKRWVSARFAWPVHQHSSCLQCLLPGLCTAAFSPRFL